MVMGLLSLASKYMYLVETRKNREGRGAYGARRSSSTAVEVLVPRQAQKPITFDRLWIRPTQRLSNVVPAQGRQAYAERDLSAAGCAKGPQRTHLMTSGTKDPSSYIIVSCVVASTHSLLRATSRVLA